MQCSMKSEDCQKRDGRPPSSVGRGCWSARHRARGARSVGPCRQLPCAASLHGRAIPLPSDAAVLRRGLASWDDKITTPPGLYLFGAAAARLAAPVLPVNLYCSLPFLRMLNVWFNLGSLVLMARLTGSWLRALAVCALPSHFFFAFLYYTDAGGAFFVLAMLYCLEQQQQCQHAAGRSQRRQSAVLVGWHAAGASCAAASVMFRQTNVVWVAYAVGLSTLQQIARRGRASGNGALIGTLDQLRLLVVSGPTVALRWVPGHVACLGAFAAFVWHNGGIVLGDKANHVVALHLAQICYFSVFVAACSGVAIRVVAIAPRQLVWAQCSMKSGALVLCAGAACLVCVKWGTIAHPFLLADNRHFTFYLWKDILSRQWIRYAAIPLYAVSMVYSAALLVEAERINNPHPAATSTAWYALGLLAATVLCLVPSPLLELRYFTVPYLVYCWRLHSARTRREEGQREALLVLVLHCLGNAFVFGVFLWKPIVSVDGEVIGRLMV